MKSSPRLHAPRAHRRLPVTALLAVSLVIVAPVVAGAESPPPGQTHRGTENRASEDHASETWHSDLEAAVREARQRDAYLVVDLFADWCGWCKKLEADVFPAEEFLRFADGKVLLRVDVEDGATGTELQARYKAFNLPTTLILDADLVQVGLVSGFAPAEQLVARFEAEIAAWERIVSRYPQVVETGSDELRRSMAKEFYRRSDGGRSAALVGKVLEAGGQLLDAPYLYYMKADAHRLARDFEAAAHAATRSRDLSQDRSLVEKLDLLDYRIAQDAGDCQKAKSTLQAFLDRNPQSTKRRQVARRLEALEKGSAGICA